ncbi:sugar transferase [Ferrimonas aestuarii]|uniref:Glycosyltransferase n=1 Tax=Ferrimonas aestuarii TaxID=2569539 RepID=A0A4U1BR47_9GAMM|nr:sugar transferase [Ferrimonas aestuarii]TKB57294.1 glycosyltransferase [Ferrimonas aestuarii]
MIWILFVALTAVLLLHFVVHPLWMGRLAVQSSALAPERPNQRRPEPWRKRHTIEVMIPCFNEARALGFKLNNLLKTEYCPKHLTVSVLLDGCDDDSPKVAADFRRRFAQRGIRFQVFNHQQNRGKIHRLNQHIARAKKRAQLVVLSDCSALLSHDALDHVDYAFDDPNLGGLCGHYFHGTDVRLKPHWQRLNKNRMGESALGAVIGGTGAAMALRSCWTQALDSNCINDDFELLMAMTRKGKRTAYEDRFKAIDMAPRSAERIFNQRLRIAAGNVLQLPTLFACLPKLGVQAAAAALMGKGLRAFVPMLLPLWAISFVMLIESLSAGLGMTLVIVGLTAALLSLAMAKGKLPWLNWVKALAGACIGSALQMLGVKVLWRRQWMNYKPKAVAAIKRGLDLSLAAIGLALVLPLFPFIALAIVLDSKGGVFYKQLRVGARHSDRTELIYVVKFRTMSSDAEKSGAQWAKAGDCRVTRVGRFLRNTRLDELPQLFQVLTGQMSLVGPRPERPQFCGELEQSLPFYLERTYELKPGLTGLAQVHQSGDTCLEDVKNKLMYDHAYAASLTGIGSYLAMEAQILFKTVYVVIAAKGH